jgi:hypothetical protein
MPSEDLRDNKRAIRTERRISIPINITFVGWNGTYEERTLNNQTTAFQHLGAHYASYFAKDFR